ncbi:SDR family NAD(P)-dependent oxidoreductase [Sphingomonas morindae]|uniref:SDR family oxidoreductase n=1 Tax=Sphingomonas morindae TaxID=1541170 RepID=A0ABY4X7M1_9SPHN|nr:SDR family oxidoreductase [Sphingomonas morindae]USI72895.1 SDR family oxidoreductase [Sphingomonas morindae]
MSQSIMIIGAGPAIGRGVAERFGEAGWSVVLTARDPDRLVEEAAALSTKGIAVHTVPADATDPVALRAAIAKGDELTGGLTVVHFNAAVVRIQDLFSMTDAEVTRDLAINVAAGLHTIRAAVSLFGDRGGTILITGGGIATAPNPNAVSLGVGKVAMRHAVQALVKPLAERGIRIATATVRERILPDSAESAGVADLMWRLATDREAPWELDYRAP